MKTPTIVIIALLSGILGGYLAARLGASPEAPEPTPIMDPAGATPAGVDVKTEAALASLTTEIDTLRGRIADMENGRSKLLAAVESATQKEVAVAVAKAQRERATVASQTPPDIHTDVRRALNEIRDQEAQQAQVKRQSTALQRHQKWVSRVSQELQLNAHQESEMTRILAEQTQLREAAYEAMRVAGDYSGKGTLIRETTAQTNQALSAMMSPAQFEQYQQIAASRRQGRGK